MYVADTLLAMMLRKCVAMAVFLGVLACACNEDGNGGDSASAPPQGVPTAAAPVIEAVAIGEIAPEEDTGDKRTFVSLTCSADILTIVTDRERVYATLPCDRSLPPEVAARFNGEPVRLRVEPGDSVKLYLDSESQGSAEFTVGAVWIAPAD
jgi:hypothetical protein